MYKRQGQSAPEREALCYTTLPGVIASEIVNLSNPELITVSVFDSEFDQSDLSHNLNIRTRRPEIV